MIKVLTELTYKIFLNTKYVFSEDEVSEFLKPSFAPVGQPRIEGSCFGEIGLEGGNPRKTTAIALELTETFTLSCEDYISILQEFQAKEVDLKMKVLR